MDAVLLSKGVLQRELRKSPVLKWGKCLQVCGCHSGLVVNWHFSQHLKSPEHLARGPPHSFPH